jgi:DNA replication and repair protein RecF
MAIENLRIVDFRCFETAKLRFAPRCTVISGPNGAGKTSILEAITLLSRGRSFRTSQQDAFFRAERATFMLAADATQNSLVKTIEVKWSKADKLISINGCRARGFSTASSIVPVQIIEPNTHKLLEDGPIGRRKFLDWGVFHVEPRFLEAWQRYHRALSQRNMALRLQQSPAMVRMWNEPLDLSGSEIAMFRREYVGNFEKIFCELAQQLTEFSVEIVLKDGWEGRSLGEAIDLTFPRDQRLRATTVGPHRADLEVLVDGVPAKNRVSRGQQKLLSCALVLAQLRCHVSYDLSPATLLLDDPAAELDVDNLGKFLVEVTKTPAQLIATALEPASLEGFQPERMFHVKQGQFRSVL